MKNIFNLAVMLLICMIKPAEAQDEKDYIEFNDRRNVVHGVYMGFMTSYGLTDESDTYIGSFKLAYVANQTFEVGFEAVGFYVDRYYMDLAMPSIDVYAGYGGLHLEPILFGRQKVNLAFPILIGGGGVFYDDDHPWIPGTFYDNWDYLNISLKNHTRLRGNVTLTAHITTRHLTHFDVSGASQLYLNNELVSENVAIDLSGASGFSGEVFSEHLNLEGSGASTFDLSGSVGRLEGRVSGASTLRNFDLYTDQLKLKLSGASNAYLTVRELIDFRGSGASTLIYKGNPHIGSSDISGASRMVHRN